MSEQELAVHAPGGQTWRGGPPSAFKCRELWVGQVVVVNDNGCPIVWREVAT